MLALAWPRGSEEVVTAGSRAFNESKSENKKIDHPGVSTKRERGPSSDPLIASNWLYNYTHDYRFVRSISCLGSDETVRPEGRRRRR